MPLLVRVRGDSSGAEHKRFFSTSPVRIGRNPLNDLPLDYGFVSQWHGVIKFDRSDTYYVDLGSTNGTWVDGIRIQERTPVRIAGPHTKLSIGSVELFVQWSEEIQEPGTAPPKIRTQFVTSLPAWASAESPPRADARSGRAGPSALPMPAEREADSTESTPTLQGPLMAVEEVRGPYDGYRESWRRLLPELRAKIESAPPALREMTALFITTEFPQVTREPEFAQLLTDLGIDRLTAGCLDIEEWLVRLTGDQEFSSQKSSPAIAMEHVGATLEVFADSFLELRRGYGQFEKEMGLQIIHDQSELERASAVREVIAYLMHPDFDQSERLNELKRSFASFALHQVAIMGASVEGARELLDSLSPASIASSGGSASSSSTAITARRHEIIDRLLNLWPIGPLISWSRYKRHFEATREEDSFTRKLFGRKFMRAYLALIGSQESR